MIKIAECFFILCKRGRGYTFIAMFPFPHVFSPSPFPLEREPTATA